MYKKLLIMGIVMCAIGMMVACGQNKQPTDQPADSAIWGVTADGTEIYLIVEHEPEFPGGLDSLYSFLNKNIHYPEEALKNRIEGKVFAQFIVEKDGSITHAKIIRDIVHGSTEADSLASELGCGAEALRVINMMPKWKPASNYGVIVRYQYTFPIEFSLSKEMANPMHLK